MLSISKKILVLSLFVFVWACTNKNKPETSKKTITYSNITMNLPHKTDVAPSNSKMILSTIKGEKSDLIKVFNFGNKPILVEANITRWESQFDTVFTTEKKDLKKGLIHFIKIEGIKQTEESILIAGIIPTNDGPYYLKADCNRSSIDDTQDVLLKLLNSISYNK